MGRLIDVDVAIRAAVEYIEDWNRVQSMYHRRKLTEKFMALPTVDAVPVVRCEDCARFDKKRGCNLVEGLNIAKTDSFCSYGERKDGDHEKAD